MDHFLLFAKLPLCEHFFACFVTHNDPATLRSSEPVGGDLASIDKSCSETVD
jgi:hypothetical protein